MIINDLILLNALGTENFEIQNYDELDLNNQNILNELSKIKNIKISFNKNSNIEVTIKQLCELIDKCPNLEFCYIYSSNLNSKDININYLIDILIDHNVKLVNISGFNYNYSSFSPP